jgi:hypothetical protein
MPSRWVCWLIIIVWLAVGFWFVQKEFLPRWLAVDDAPAFTFELSDEAAPKYVNWIIYRGKEQIGFLGSRQVFVPATRLFEVESRFNNLQMKMPIPLLGLAFELKSPFLNSTSVLNRQGELQTLRCEGKFEINLSGGGNAKLPANDAKAEFDVSLNGVVTAGEFTGDAAITSPFGKMNNELTPFPVRAGLTFNPFQPQDRLTDLTPGQSWKVTLVDPVSDAMTQAAIQTITKIAKENKLDLFDPAKMLKRPAVEFIGTVLPETVTLNWRDADHVCQLVEYKSNDLTNRTWVRQSDGKVLKQEASGLGEKLTLLREK